jgi:hypothetical protein
VKNLLPFSLKIIKYIYIYIYIYIKQQKENIKKLERWLLASALGVAVSWWMARGHRFFVLY